jgi:hypothetical protein
MDLKIAQPSFGRKEVNGKEWGMDPASRHDEEVYAKRAKSDVQALNIRYN